MRSLLRSLALAAMLFSWGDRSLTAAPLTDSLAPSDAMTEMVREVRAAARFVHARGERAFDEFRKTDGNRSPVKSRLFVVSFTGTVLIDQASPELVGAHLSGLRDPQGVAVLDALRQSVCNPRRDGWSSYRWPDRFTETAPQVRSYSMLIRAPSGKLYIVGGTIPSRAGRAATPATSLTTNVEASSLDADAGSPSLTESP